MCDALFCFPCNAQFEQCVPVERISTFWTASSNHDRFLREPFTQNITQLLMSTSFYTLDPNFDVCQSQELKLKVVFITFLGNTFNTWAKGAKPWGTLLLKNVVALADFKLEIEFFCCLASKQAIKDRLSSPTTFASD